MSVDAQQIGDSVTYLPFFLSVAQNYASLVNELHANNRITCMQYSAPTVCVESSDFLRHLE